MSNCGSSLGLKIVGSSKSILLPPAAVGFHRYYSYLVFKAATETGIGEQDIGKLKFTGFFH